MKRKKWTRSEKILWLTPGLFLACVGGIIYAPRLSHRLEATLESWGIDTPGKTQRSTCISNLKTISLAALVYANDYDGFYPPVATSTADFGWAGLVQLYSYPSYHCPANPLATSGMVTSSTYTNYYYNARLSWVDTDRVESPAQTILFGEGTRSDARYAKTQLPSQWVSQSDSPAHLHYLPGMTSLSGAHYACADGHVIRTAPQFISSGPIKAGGWTFALR